MEYTNTIEHDNEGFGGRGWWSVGGASLSLVGRGAFEFATTFGGRAMGRCWSMLKSAYMYIIWRAIGRGVGAVQNWRVCTHCYVLLRVLG